MKQTQRILIISGKGLFYIVVHFVLLFQLSSCFLKQDRTTTVYGTITDQTGAPVDSILIIFDGVKNFTYDSLGASLSDANGEFETLLEIPKRYTAVNVAIPYGSYINPKFQKHYKSYNIYKNDKPTDNCCVASIGQKTKYNFQLIPR